jgi:soluble P-type ATPase
MIKLDIPGKGLIELQHAVFDINGTLAIDGKSIPQVVERLRALANLLSIHALTAGTHGKLVELEWELGMPLQRIETGADKARFIEQLGPAHVAAVGNGSNDVPMLRLAAIGIAVLSGEGVSSAALQAADVLAQGPLDAIDLLLHPKRLIATLRL